MHTLDCVRPLINLGDRKEEEEEDEEEEEEEERKTVSNLSFLARAGVCLDRQRKCQMRRCWGRGGGGGERKFEQGFFSPAVAPSPLPR